MAARLNRKHQESVREKIRASQIVNRLENHVFGEVDLSAKCVPDLTAAQLTGAEGGPVEIRSIERVIVDPKD